MMMKITMTMKMMSEGQVCINRNSIVLELEVILAENRDKVMMTMSILVMGNNQIQAKYNKHWLIIWMRMNMMMTTKTISELILTYYYKS